MYRIGIEFEFESAHFLTGLPDTHKCTRLHGHNYTMVVECKSETLDATGFIIDYFDLKFIKDYIDKHLDHRLLNDVLPFNPTVENMCKHFFEIFSAQCPQICKIGIRETPTTYATYGTEN